ncbi:MAG: hypothetical protein LBN39_06575 [Planctomycetaceae bacterium]|nr:hypothetical protein [Planctomycetaceae bacterium]
MGYVKSENPWGTRNCYLSMSEDARKWSSNPNPLLVQRALETPLLGGIDKIPIRKRHTLRRG